jgi:hypothetical protein
MTNGGVTTPFPNLISSMRPADRTLMLKLHPHHGGTTASLPIRRPFAITWRRPARRGKRVHHWSRPEPTHAASDPPLGPKL